MISGSSGGIIAAAATVSTFTILSLLLSLEVFLLMLVTFLFVLTLSFLVVVGHFGIIFFSPLVSWLQLLWIKVDVEEVKVTILVVSEGEGLRFDPSFALQLISVQELVAQDIFAIWCIVHDELSLGVPTISEWVWSWCKSVCVKELQHNLRFLESVLLLLEADEDRLVVVSNVDEGLGVGIPEEHAVLSSFVPLDPEPPRLELKLGVIIKGLGITKIRSSSLSLLGDVESLASN